MSHDHFSVSAAPERNHVIIRTSMIGIAANLALAGSKAAIGALTHSIAVVLDAVNNLSDVLSSVITIIGSKLAGKEPDKKHPLGHGRIEYLSAMIVAAIVLYAGVASLVESIKKILHPQTADYSVVSLVVIALAVIVKLVLGRYVKRKGQAVNSGSLVASGADALFDAVLSASVLLSAIVFLIWNLSLEAYIGVLISLFIIKSGVEMLLETMNEILGKRADRELIQAIKETICEDPDARGAYDLILHSYGPETVVGSVHVEVPSAMTADEIDRMSRRLSQEIYKRHGVLMTGIGIYSADLSPQSRAARERIEEIVSGHKGVLQTHGFYLDEEEKTIVFDLILDFSLPNRKEVYDAICAETQAAFPDYKVQITNDIDI